MPKAQPRISWGGLSDEQKNEITDARIDGKSIEFLYEEYGISGPVETFGRRIREWNSKRGTRSGKITVGRGNFEEHWKLYCKLIGRDVKKPLPKGKNKTGKQLKQKIVVLCDVHGSPDTGVWDSAINEQADIYNLAGDVFDAFSFSSFIKDRKAPIADELARIRAGMETILTQVPHARIELIEGNHDFRARDYFIKRIDPEFCCPPFVNYNLLEIVSLGLDRAHVIKNHYKFQSPTGRETSELSTAHFSHIGEDAIISHAEKARKGEIRTVDSVAEWIDLWRKPLGWKEPVLIVQAHVHRAGISYPQGGHQVRVEGGFSGEVSTLQYAMEARNTGYTPPVLGYTVFEMSNVGGKWYTDKASVKFVLC